MSECAANQNQKQNSKMMKCDQPTAMQTFGSRHAARKFKDAHDHGVQEKLIPARGPGTVCIGVHNTKTIVWLHQRHKFSKCEQQVIRDPPVSCVHTAAKGHFL